MSQNFDVNNPQSYRWTRSNVGILGGVCRGIADATGLESWLVRVIWLVMIFSFGTGVLLYLILAVCLPRVDKLDQALDRKLLGVCARISRRSETEVGLVRVGFVCFALITFGVAILVYGLLYFFLPEVPESNKSSTGRRSS